MACVLISKIYIRLKKKLPGNELFQFNEISFYFSINIEIFFLFKLLF